MDYGIVRLLGAQTVARNNAGTLTDIVTLDGSFTLGAATATIQGSAGPAAGVRGSSIAITGGTGNTSGAGGGVTVSGGAGGATGNGASVTLNGGSGGATSGDGGNVQTNAGSAGPVGDGGFIAFAAGDGGATSGVGGYLEFIAGVAQTSGIGGTVSFACGDGGATDGAGGGFDFVGGSAQANNDAGGGFLFTAGNADGAGQGGFFTLQVGAGGSEGYVELLGPAGGGSAALRFLEPDAGGTAFVSFQAPALAASTAYVLPDAFPAVTGYLLSSTDAGIMSWVAPGGGGGAGVFRDTFVEADLTGDDLVISTGLGLAANAVASVTVRDSNNNIIQPDLVTFDATPDQITINLASYRNPTLSGTYQVVVIG